MYYTLLFYTDYTVCYVVNGLTVVLLQTKNEEKQNTNTCKHQSRKPGTIREWNQALGVCKAH